MAVMESPVRELTEFHYKAAHEMFVPAGRTVTPDELGGFVLDTYARASIERNEDLDAMLIGDMHRFLPMPEDEIIRLADDYGIGYLAEQTLEQVNLETANQIRAARGIAKLLSIHPDKELLASADLFSQHAHMGDSRKSKKPYHTHVFRVAAVGFYVARTLEAEGLRNDPSYTEAEIITRVYHDAIENTFVAGKHYDPHRQGHHSPLLIMKLMEQFDHPYARETADALRLITHLRGMPWMRTWQDYVRERVMQSLLADQAKDDDRDDNLRNEPKPVFTREEWDRREIKHADYTLMGPELKQRALELAPTPRDVIWIARANEIRRNLRPGLHEEKVQTLQRFIYEEAA